MDTYELTNFGYQWVCTQVGIFFQGPIFGFQVSGMETDKLINHTLSGKIWITGGVFGPEAGIIVVPVVIFAIGIVYLYTKKQKI
jgi:hypothetical protein